MVKNKIITLLFLFSIIVTGCFQSPQEALPETLSATSTPTPENSVGNALETSSVDIVYSDSQVEAELLVETEKEYKVGFYLAIPTSLKNGLSSLNGIYPATSSESSDIMVNVLNQEAIDNGGQLLSNWVYALATPFPTVLDNVGYSDLYYGWLGETANFLNGKPILMSEETKAAFELWWGPAAEGAVAVVQAEELLQTAWIEPYSWALIPFDELEPRWKVIRIDGISPYDKSFEITKYPLSISFGISGDAQTISEVKSLIDRSSTMLSTNRDPDKLTVVILTGVTALVRMTALRMEENGVQYPGEDIGGWLLNGDITHISNEVPFYSQCPPAIPLRTEARFCSDPKYLGLFDYVGVDVVELTGNHVMDWGQEALLETLEIYNENDIPYYGGGLNLEESMQPYLIEHNGNRLAFVGCNPMGPENVWATENTPGAAPCDFEYLTQTLQSLTQDGYLPIFTFQHFELCEFEPQSAQRTDFPAMAEAGAVIVSGSQAHCPQGMTFFQDHFIHYGLGNLFFDQMDEVTRREFIDRHVFYDGRYIGTELLTAMLEDYSKPRIMTQEERQKFLEEAFQSSVWY